MASYAARVRGALVAAILFLAFISAIPSRAANLNDVMNAAVRLQMPKSEDAESEGAGVVIGTSDETVFIVTAKHVVERQQTIAVFFNAARHKKYTGRVIHMSDEVDLAVVAVDLPAGDIRRSLRRIETHDGRLERLAVVSNISHVPDQWELNAGVNRLQGEQLNTLTFTKVGILEGASGGPLLDNDNRLVGMVTTIDGTKATALKIKVVLDMLRLWNVRTNNLGAVATDEKVLLADHFDDNHNNWYISSDRAAPAGLEQGRYKLGSKRNEWRFTTIPAPLEPSQPFRISVKVTKVRGDDDYFYGLMWGARDSEHFYNLAITSSGHVAVTVKNDGQFTNFNDPGFVNPHVKQGNATNVLTVARVDDDLRFQVNGETVHEMPFQPFFAGYVGFLVYQDVHVAFDDLEVFGVQRPVVINPQPEKEDPLTRLAREKNAQILQLNASLAGTIADQATLLCVFPGTQNTPLLFTFERTTPKAFRALVDVFDADGASLLKDQHFYLRKTAFSFVPPKDGAYVLRLTGTSGFGGFTAALSRLTSPPSP
jgi:hypothetical protein